MYTPVDKRNSFIGMAVQFDQVLQEDALIRVCGLAPAFRKCFKRAPTYCLYRIVVHSIYFPSSVRMVLACWRNECRDAV